MVGGPVPMYTPARAGLVCRGDEFAGALEPPPPLRINSAFFAQSTALSMHRMAHSGDAHPAAAEDLRPLGSPRGLHSQ